MIAEGLLTTQNPDGTTNIAPMGPIVSGDFESFLFRPFITSTTYQNLKRTRAGVFHITDDVLLIARFALNIAGPDPVLCPASKVAGHVLRHACRWYEVEIETIDDSRDRTEMQARTVHLGRGRDFWGFNRAKHAVLEATILATRLHLISKPEIDAALASLRIIVEKTAGADEREAFDLVTLFIAKKSS